MRLPKTLGKTADLLLQMRKERLALQAKVDEAKAQEQTVREYALQLLARERAESARGAFAQMTKMVVDLPQVKDWEDVYAYVRKHNAFDLLERRVHRLAWRDRVDQEGEIPGIAHETKIDLHVTSKRGA
jgi:hypothetical protein